MPLRLQPAVAESHPHEAGARPLLNITIKAAKSNFFDRAAVIKAVDKATRAALSKLGAYIRTRAKSSIKEPGKKVRKAAFAAGLAGPTSKPGNPPFSHTKLLKRFIFHVYDGQRRSVVIGPALLNGTEDPNALSALEHGGASSMIDWKTGKRRRIQVKARPFMGPALEAELPNFPQFFRNQVR